jgi:hypothetical protein
LKAVWDAWWRACGSCLHWRVLLWSLLPLGMATAAVGGLGYAYWETAVAGVRHTLEDWELIAKLLRWLDSMGWQSLRAVLAPMLVVAMAIPVVLLTTLLLVAALVTPAVVRLVATRRFADLFEARGASTVHAVAWSLLCTLAAVLALLLSVPLWFVPPLVLLVPPLIWGWLTYRILAFDVLARHASADERRWLLRHKRWPLLAMGVACGYVGSLPSLIWSAGTPALIAAPLLGPVAVWLYTLVFVFAACWFAHYLLAALAAHRSSTPNTVRLSTVRPELVEGPGSAD